MLPFPIGRRRGAERQDHCRRVALLASKISAHLPLRGISAARLTAAARIHHDWSAFHAASGDPGPVFDRPASAILERLWETGPAADSSRDLAARILEVCNAFDEAMEFAAFERMTLRDAADSFFEETAAQFDAPIVSALRRTTEGDWKPPSPSHLPAMPKRVAALLQTSEDTASPAQLAMIAAGDPVLTGRLIGVANSGRYGSRHTIVSVNEAVLRVGVPVARRVLVAACLGGLFASLPLRKLWQHSQDVAAAAFDLSEECGINRDLAWLAGLVHDIGRLVFISCQPAATAKLNELLASGFPLVYAETLTFRSDHAAAGAEVLRNWALPDEVVCAVAAHHEPERTEDALTSLLFLAEQCAARRAQPPAEPEGLCNGLRSAVACRNTGLTEAALERIGDVSDSFALAI